MNKFNRLRTSVPLLVTSLLISNAVHAQSVQYLPPFDLSMNGKNSYQLAGKIENNYLLYYSEPSASPQMICFNEEGVVMNTHSLDFIKPGKATNVNMVTLPERLNIIVQELRDNKHYIFIAALSASGTLLEEPHIIDSTRYDLYGTSAFYTVLSSPDKKFSLLYRVISGFSSSHIMFNGILLNEKGLILGSTSFYVPFNSDLEQTGTIFISNQGTLFFPVHDKPENYHVGTTLRIYQSNFSNKAPQITEVYLKENKPAELFLDWYDAKNQLVLGGLYYDFYKKHLDGAITIFITPGNNKPDTVIYMPLEKEFRKQLKKHIYNIPTTDAINSLQVRYFDVSENGSVTMLSDMFTNSALVNKIMPLGFNTETPAETSYRERLRYQSTTQNSANSNSTNTNRLNPDRSLTNTGRNRNSPAIPTNPVPQSVQNTLQNDPLRITQPYLLRNTADAGDILAMNKTLNYKSVIFSIDSSHTVIWKDWVQNLYIPGTSFSNVIIMPADNSVGLLSYEVNNKNKPYLLSQFFTPAGKTITQPVGEAGAPMLFYKKNAVLINSKSLITLYTDQQQNKMGLAIIKW